jgi:hypothetical protein
MDGNATVCSLLVLLAMSIAYRGETKQRGVVRFGHKILDQKTWSSVCLTSEVKLHASRWEVLASSAREVSGVGQCLRREEYFSLASAREVSSF